MISNIDMQLYMEHLEWICQFVTRQEEGLLSIEEIIKQGSCYKDALGQVILINAIYIYGNSTMLILLIF